MTHYPPRKAGQRWRAVGLPLGTELGPGFKTLDFTLKEEFDTVWNGKAWCIHQVSKPGYSIVTEAWWNPDNKYHFMIFLCEHGHKDDL